MRNATLVLAVACSAALAFGQQLDSNSVTVSASRTTTVLPDQAIFAVYVDAPLTSGFDDVLTAVAPAGITAANFSSVGDAQNFGQEPASPMLEWAFGLPVPLSKTKDTVTSLTNLAQNLDKQNNTLKLRFSVQGSQVSPQLQQSQTCAIPDLVSDARAQAQKLADAAAMSLGPILAISSITSANTGAPVPYISVSAFVTSSTFGSYSYPPVCSISVKFGLTRY